MPISIAGEQLVPTLRLAVMKILNFQPRRATAVALIRALAPLGHDALEIAFAGEFVKTFAADGNRLSSINRDSIRGRMRASRRLR